MRRQLSSLRKAALACMLLMGVSATAWAEGIIVQGSVTSEAPSTGSYAQLDDGTTVTAPEPEPAEAPTGSAPDGGTTVGEDELGEEELDGELEVPEDWECTDIGGGVEYCEPPEEDGERDRSTTCGMESQGCASGRPLDLGVGILSGLMVALVMVRRRRMTHG